MGRTRPRSRQRASQARCVQRRSNPGGIAGDVAGDGADSAGIQLGRKPLRVVGLKVGSPDPFGPDGLARRCRPGGLHRGRPSGSGNRAELGQRAVGDHQLLVRGRLEREVGVAREQDPAGGEVDGHRRRLAAQVAAHRGRIGCRRGEQGDGAARSREPCSKSHRTQILPENLGLSESQDGTGGP